MSGNKGVFADIQFLKPWKENNYKFTVFSRTRSTLDYDNNSNILSMAYINYTSKIGFGGSIIGSISSVSGFGPAAGINYFKTHKDFSIFALIAVEIDKVPGYSFFTLMKYRPDLSEKLKLYTSVELFSLVNETGHLVSVERLRLGLDIKNIQFGAASNLGQYGSSFNYTGNYGVFIRKEF